MNLGNIAPDEVLPLTRCGWGCARTPRLSPSAVTRCGARCRGQRTATSSRALPRGLGQPRSRRFALDEAALRDHFLGREAYRRTRFVVARRDDAGATALLRVERSRGARCSRRSSTSRCSPGRTSAPTSWSREADTAVPSALARRRRVASGRPGARAVVVAGPLRARQLHRRTRPAAPRRPGGRAARSRRSCSTRRAGCSPSPRTCRPSCRWPTPVRPCRPRRRGARRHYLLPCGGSGVAVAGAQLSYLDQRPPRGLDPARLRPVPGHPPARSTASDAADRRHVPAGGARTTPAPRSSPSAACWRTTSSRRRRRVVVPWGASLGQVRRGAARARRRAGAPSGDPADRSRARTRTCGARRARRALRRARPCCSPGSTSSPRWPRRRPSSASSRPRRRRQIASHARVDGSTSTSSPRRPGAPSHSTLGLIRGAAAACSRSPPASTSTTARPSRTSPTPGSALVMRDVGALVWRDLRACEARLLRARRAAPRHRHGRPHPRPARRADHVRVQGRVLGRRGRAATSTGSRGRGPLVRRAARRRGRRPGVLRARRAGAACAAFCARLGLGDPGVSWLTARDRVAEFGSVLAMVCGTLARIGNEVYELHRPEIGELAEPAPAGRGRQHHDAAQAQPGGERAPGHPRPARAGVVRRCWSRAWSAGTSATGGRGRRSGSRCPRSAAHGGRRCAGRRLSTGSRWTPRRCAPPRPVRRARLRAGARRRCPRASASTAPRRPCRRCCARSGATVVDLLNALARRGSPLRRSCASWGTLGSRRQRPRRWSTPWSPGRARRAAAEPERWR